MKRTPPIRVPVAPGSADWRRLRRTGVGASDIPVITGDARFGDVTSLYQEKLGYAAERLETDSMAAGHWLEDLIARWYGEQTGRRVRRINALLRKRSAPWMMATPDRDVGGRLLEVKVTDHAGDAWGEPGSDQVPDEVREQVTWQAEVADVDVVDVAVFFTRSRRREHYSVGRDRSLVDELIEYGAAFWRCVKTRTPPDPVGRQVHALLRADEIEADNELAILAEAYRLQVDEVKGAEAGLEETKRRIRERLADVGGARGPGFRIHYRPNADSTRVAWEKVAAAYRELLIQAEWPLEDIARVERELTTTVPGARPLLVKQAKEHSLVTAA